MDYNYWVIRYWTVTKSQHYKPRTNYVHKSQHLFVLQRTGTYANTYLHLEDYPSYSNRLSVLLSIRQHITSI